MEKTLIPERIKAARESLGITKSEAARRINLSKIGYCRYEYGERTPSIQTLEVIARCFHTSVGYLTGESDNTEPDFVVIYKKDNEELFELVSTLQDNPDLLSRLLAYSQAITNEDAG